MRISVFGLGYVGCVSLGCLSKMGYSVIGVDVSQQKNELINKGIPTILERDIEKLIKEGFNNGLIRATNNVSDAIKNSDISFICVGTPNGINGHLCLDQLIKVSIDIAESLKNKAEFHMIVIRSTIVPGASEEISNVISEISHKTSDKDFCVLVNPEFLREGTAVDDYFNPSITVIGGRSLRGINYLLELYKELPGDKEIVELKVAESIKLLNNSFHALKVAFANEIGNISKSLGINTQQLIDVFLKDIKLNVSPAYLRPGFAFGGSCLPKDLRALNLIAHDAYLNTPVLSSIEKSNKHQIDRALKLIEDYKIKDLAFWGISFKDGTDDLRSSPVIYLIEHLLGKGYNVKIYDENVNESQLIGANKEFIEKVFPHFRSLLLKDFDELLTSSGLLVINKKGDANIYDKILSKAELRIFDLKDIPVLSQHKFYQGLNW